MMMIIVVVLFERILIGITHISVDVIGSFIKHRFVHFDDGFNVENFTIIGNVR